MYGIGTLGIGGAIILCAGFCLATLFLIFNIRFSTISLHFDPNELCFRWKLLITVDQFSVPIGNAVGFRMKTKSDSNTKVWYVLVGETTDATFDLYESLEQDEVRLILNNMNQALAYIRGIDKIVPMNDPVDSNRMDYHSIPAFQPERHQCRETPVYPKPDSTRWSCQVNSDGTVLSRRGSINPLQLGEIVLYDLFFMVGVMICKEDFFAGTNGAATVIFPIAVIGGALTTFAFTLMLFSWFYSEKIVASNEKLEIAKRFMGLGRVREISIKPSL